MSQKILILHDETLFNAFFKALEAYENASGNTNSYWQLSLAIHIAKSKKRLYKLKQFADFIQQISILSSANEHVGVVVKVINEE